MTKSEEVSQGISRLLVWVAVAAPLAVSPWTTTDPINLVKLVVLTVSAFGIAFLLFSNLGILKDGKLQAVSIAAALFVTQLSLVFFNSETDKGMQFFGTMGRNTGLLCYISLVALLFAAATVSSQNLNRALINSFTVVGGLSAIYGLIQYLGADPIRWANKFDPIIGFVGNPNFQSALLGLAGIATLVITLDNSVASIKRLVCGLSLMLALLMAALSDSQQGLMVFAIGVVILGFFNIKALKKKNLTWIFSGFTGILFSGAIFGFLNKGFLANYLYQDSVTFRGDYWRAGWRMAIENPLLGLGLDSFGDNYRKYRTLEATLRRGPDVITNAAHNIFIDFAANGGLPLLFIYFSFLIICGKKIWCYSRSDTRDKYFEAVIAVWVGFIAQSLISINQIGIAVWGWILTGVIAGWKVQTVSRVKEQKLESVKIHKDKGFSPRNLMILLVGMITGLLISLPPFIASANHKSAMATAKLELILKAESKWPKDPARSNQIAVILVSNSLNTEALVITKKTVDQFPNNYDAWKVYSEIPTVSAIEKKAALAQMKILDPLNPNLK
jgi:O-antigen ligase